MFLRLAALLQVLPLLILRAEGARVPRSFGMMVFPGVFSLDVVGPRSMLDEVAFTQNFTISYIAETKDLVHSNVANGTTFLPTYTFDENPELDVLLIPGGPGAYAAHDNPAVIDYVKRTYPKLQYIMSVCTGTQILAGSEVLDGKNATTNKAEWKLQTSTGPATNWIAKARWIVDGNVWTSAGVTSGMDMTYNFIATVLKNETLANRAKDIIEYEPHKDPSWDPFSEI